MQSHFITRYLLGVHQHLVTMLCIVQLFVWESDSLCSTSDKFDATVELLLDPRLKSNGHIKLHEHTCPIFTMLAAIAVLLSTSSIKLMHDTDMSSRLSNSLCSLHEQPVPNIEYKLHASTRPSFLECSCLSIRSIILRDADSNVPPHSCCE